MSDNLSVPDNLKRAFDQENAKTTEDLLESITQGFRLELAIIAQRAVQIRILEGRGVSQEQIRNSVMRSLYRPLLLASYGQLALEVIAAFVGNTALLQAMAKLPMPEQIRLAKEKTVPLLSFVGDEPTQRNAELENLTAKQIKQVFAEDYVRDKGQQLIHLEQKRTEEKIKSRGRKRERFGNLEIDYDLKTIRAVVRGYLDPKDMKAALRALGE